MFLRKLVFALAAAAFAIGPTGVSVREGSAAGAARGLSSCSGATDWSRAERMVGRVATLKGPVMSAMFTTTSRGSPTVLDLGARYPSPRRATVVISLASRARFGSPEQRYRGRTICVHGWVSIYGGVPAVEVTSPTQIHITG